MSELKKNLGLAMNTGRVVFGAKQTIKALKTGNVKLTLISSTCPKNIKEEIVYISKLSGIPVLELKENSEELGTLCGKQFNVSSLAIIEFGEAKFNSLIITKEVK